MAFNDLEIQKIKNTIETEFMAKRRPPLEIRTQLDFGYRITGQSVELFEVRPHWREPGVIMQSEIAKATYVKTQNVWKIYWMRQDLKWHGYEPCPQVSTLEAFLEIVAEDAYACFFG